MPIARSWTSSADKVILDMRGAGETWASIARVLALSRNTVIERGRRLNATAPAHPPRPPAEQHDLDDPNRPPLPAGHPLTWGLISDQPYPETEGRP